MDAGSPTETTPQTEEEARKEAMKGMANTVLSHAREVISQNQLSQDPKRANFAWTFFGTTKVPGIMPSITALNLAAFAEGQKTPSEADIEQRLTTTEDPKAIEALEYTKELVARSVVASFWGVNDQKLASRFGSNIDHALTINFLQGLGFLKQGETNVTHPEGKRIFEAKHPTKPFVAELIPNGWLESGGPRFNGFVLRYQPQSSALNPV